MENFLFIIVNEFLAVMVTGASCWLCEKLRRKSGWWIGFLAALGIAALVQICIHGSLLLNPSELYRHKRSLKGILVSFAIDTVICAIPSLLVVRYFRARFEARKSVVA